MGVEVSTPLILHIFVIQFAEPPIELLKVPDSLPDANL